MKSVIGNKLALLYYRTEQKTMCWLLHTNLKIKQYRWPFLLQDCLKVSISIISILYQNVSLG